MNPHIGDMRRAREMKEFVHKRKLQLSGAKNREVVPELRSIPLTFMDCGEHNEDACRIASHVGEKGIYRPMWCDILLAQGRCPRGFP